MSKQKIQELLKEAEAKLQEAEQLARETEQGFYWDGPAYGMGGWFDPNVTTNEWGEETDGWRASSNSC